MRTIPILFTFDESLLMPAGVCITSLLENASEDTFYDIFILHSEKYDLAETRLKEIPDHYKRCRITFRKVSNEFVGAYETRGIPETAYYRLIAPELIPEYDKILYSDVDVIFRDDLTKYYDIDLGDNYFGGVDNCSIFRPWTQKHLKKVLGIDYRDGYIYSGNLVIHAKQILKDGMTARFRELAKQDFEQQDMDIINIACNKRITFIDPSFCLTHYLYYFIVRERDKMRQLFSDEVLDNALKKGIVHYNGDKPWIKDCINMDIWWDYYRRSIFFDERFCHDFWHHRWRLLEHLSFMKRVKLLLRYPKDYRDFIRW